MTRPAAAPSPSPRPSSSTNTPLLEQVLLGEMPRNLNHLSFTSRIAFYALYEAWRLLQELSGIRRPQQPSALEDCRSGTGRPRIRPPPAPGSNCSTTEVSETIGLDETLEISSSSAAATFEEEEEVAGATASQQQPQQQQPDLVLYSTQPWRKSLKEEEEEVTKEGNGHCNNSSCNSCSANFEERSLSSGVNHGLLPDLIPRLGQDDCKDALEKKMTEHEDMEDKDDLGSSNSNLDKVLVATCLNLSNSCSSSWSEIGFQLCHLASAFEVSYEQSQVSQDSERELYQTYQKMRRMLLLKKRAAGSSSGLVKIVCQQVLLSGIWILLKKIF